MEYVQKHLFSLLIVIITLHLLPTTNAAISFDSIALGSTAVDSNADNVPDTRQETPFWITANLTVSLDAGAYEIEVYLIRPGSVYSTSTLGCVELVSGSTVPSTCSSTSYAVSDIVWDISDIAITTSSGIPLVTEMYVAGLEDLEILIIFDYENLTSSLIEDISITQEVYVKDHWNSSPQTFTLDAMVLNGSEPSVSSESSDYEYLANATTQTYDVEIVGPFLEGTTSSNAIANVGDTIVSTFTIAHSADTTESAYYLMINTLAISQSNEVPVSDVSIAWSGEATNISNSYSSINVTDVLSTTGEFTTSDSIDLTYTRTVGADMLIGTDIYVYITVSWEDLMGNSYQEAFIVSTSSADLDFTDPSAVDLPTEFIAGDTVQVQRVFTMPAGKLGNTEYSIEVESSGMTEIPLPSSVTASLTYDTTTYGTHVSIDSPVSQSVSVTPVSRKKRRVHLEREVAHHRVKRVVTSSWVLVVSLGNIVNGLSGGSVVNVPFTIAIQMVVARASLGGTATTQAFMTYNGISPIFSYNPSASFLVPILEITKVVSVVDTASLPHKVRFNVTVEHSAVSNAPAYSVDLTDGSTDFQVFFYEDFQPGLPSVTVVSDAVITYSDANLTTGEALFLSYKAEPADSGVNYPSGDTYYTATVSWYPTSSASSGYQLSASAAVCISKNDIIVESVFYQHGFTVLGLICGIIAGAMIGVLIILVLYLCRNKIPCMGGVAPSFSGASSAGKGLITSTSAAMQKGFNSLKNMSAAAVNESIVFFLGFKDKHRQNRQLDSWDILQTVRVDEDIEKERNEAMIKATTLLPASLRLNGDITKSTEEKCRTKFMKNLAASDKNLDNEYNKEMQDLFRRLGMKNKTKLEDVKEKQLQERQELEESLRKSSMTNEEKDELRKLKKQEQESENEDVNYSLKLEQEEESEKVRKEYSIRKRMAIKGLQQEYLDDVVREGKLPNQEQIDWLMKEHAKNQSAVETMYDEEIARQRMVLEEKLARRRALAQKAELQEEAHSDMLNTIASQHMDSIKKAKKSGHLTAAEARQMIEDAQKEMVATKDKQDVERERQEKVLHDKLSQRKKERMAELGKRQKQDLDAMDKQINTSMQTTGVDPITALQDRQQLISSQRTETAEVENELDIEHAKELEQTRNQLSETTKQELIEGKEDALQDLASNGLSDKDIQKMLQKHNKDIELLEEQQNQDKADQEANFKKKLIAQQKEWALRKEREKQEQGAVREHEDTVVRKMMDNQVAMSEDERNKILQEHEKQMVKLDNSLTLNKISQKRMLEEKLAKKRAAQLEKLEKKQALEVKKTKKEADYSEDEDGAEIELMKKHAEQRIAIMQGEKLSVDNELEEIREQMAKERFTALQEQEVKLAAMLADLQMVKAKEMAQIEEQQKAIHKLTSNLMDDLNEKGVLSDPECQKVIKIHQEEQQKLNDKLDSQRAKQEQEFKRRLFQKMKSREATLIHLQQKELEQSMGAADPEILRQKLNERLKQKEDQMSKMQQSELNESISGLGNTPAAKLRRAALLTKHMLEVEKFRNRMEKEIGQTLEELRRQNDIRRMNSIQEQDLQFINGLVRLGKFNREELENVVAMLFPTKTLEERKVLLDKLMEGYVEPQAKATKGKGKEQQPPPTKGLSRRTSTLEQRVKSASIANVETASLEGSFRGKKKKGKKGRPTPQHLSPDYDEDFDGGYGGGGGGGGYGGGHGNNQVYPQQYQQQRPDPIGRSDTPDHYGDQYDEDFDMGGGQLGLNSSGRGLGGTGGFGGSGAGLYGRTPATKLPPLESLSSPSGGKKKKKKKAVQIDNEQDYYMDQDGF